METEIKYRMFCFVPYNISDIQKGIQALHGVVEYQLEHGHLELYKKWSEIEKTVIILNGGTTGRESSMHDIIRTLRDFNLNFSLFCEPDLNDAITSINVILPSTIYDLEINKDLLEWPETFLKLEEKIKIWLSKFKLA
jgi:hypothetical protein